MMGAGKMGRKLQLLHHVILFLMLIAAAGADYSSEQDTANMSPGEGGDGSTNDDIYETALLQEEIDAEAHRNSIERETPLDQTEASLRAAKAHGGAQARNETDADDDNIGSDDAATEMTDEMFDTNMQNTTEQHSPEYYHDDSAGGGEPTTTTTTRTVAAVMRETTIPTLLATTITATAKRNRISAEDANDSDSDYIEEDYKPYANRHATKVNHEIYASVSGENSLQQRHQHPHQHQHHRPLQPSLPQAQTNTEDEYYYDDDASPETNPGGSMEQQHLQPRTRMGIGSRAGFAARPVPPAETTLTTEASSSENSNSLTPTQTPMPAVATAATVATVAAAAATVAAIGGNVQTSLRPTGKQLNNVNPPNARPEMLPEQLRNYIKDVYIRMPLAVIVDPAAPALEKTKTLYNDALQDKSINIKIVLVTLNDLDAPSAFSFNNTQEFLAGLNSTKEREGGSNAFIGVLHAAELVPYDSAVFVSTATIPPHTELVQDAAITLLKKRIRLFLLWYGDHGANENETEDTVGGILGEVAIRSGGEIIHIVGGKHSQAIDGETLTLIADAYRGSQELDVNVDTTMSSLHLKIDAPMQRATLSTPSGEINLKKMVKFKLHGSREDDKNSLDAYVPLNKLRKATTFTLKLTPSLEQAEKNYNVFLRAERKADTFLGDVIKRFESYFTTGNLIYPTRLQENNNGTPMAKSGTTHARLKFPKDDDYDEKRNSKPPKTEVETFSETEVHSDPESGTQNITMSPVVFGNQHQRINANLLQRCSTKIEMSPKSQLLVAPGTTSELLFEVTNSHCDAIYHNIQVTDERRYLLRLSPQSLQLGPYQTVTVSVTVLVPAGTPQGTTDRITFTTHGKGTTSLSLVLKVLNSIEAEDVTAPTLTWTFGSRCDFVAADSLSCAERFWTLDVTAQDWQSGIMRLQTTPAEGLFYRNSYTVGSSEPLKASYMATCCEPKVSLLAYDVAGNQRVYNIDVRDIVLTEASIAAIALGAILVLLLIVLIVASIVWCCRRRKVSLELPTYRSHSTRSM